MGVKKPPGAVPGGEGKSGNYRQPMVINRPRIMPAKPMP